MPRCLPPVVDAHTRLLILGSLPGTASLAAARYYAHPRNHFWPLLSDILGEPLADLPYAYRLAVLLARGVGLWDVVAEAVRPGSLDANLRDVRGNDLAALVATLPRLEAVAFNGGTAARIGRRLLDETGLALVDLPSSSPAYTLVYAAKLDRWRGLTPYATSVLAS